MSKMDRDLTHEELLRVAALARSIADRWEAWEKLMPRPYGTTTGTRLGESLPDGMALYSAGSEQRGIGHFVRAVRKIYNEET